MQIFIKVDGQVIDVSKVTHMKLAGREGGGPLTIHFAGGTKTTLNNADAGRLFDAMKELDCDRRLVAKAV